MSKVADANPDVFLDVFLIFGRGRRCIAFSPPDAVAACEETSSDRIRGTISWFKNHRNRGLAWFGRILTAAYGYYARLEDRIDPFERILKAMNGARRLVLSHGPSITGAHAKDRLGVILRRQRLKHVLWIGVDGALSVVALALTPVLALVPGPNIFFYYPFLRLISHYRAFRGTTSGLRMVDGSLECKVLPELARLEENLQAPRIDLRIVRNVAESLNIHGLGQFLERMV